MNSILQKIFSFLPDNSTKKITAKNVRESFAELDSKIGSVISGFQFSINPTTPTPEGGWLKGFYPAEQSGNYANAGGITVDLADGLTMLVFDGSEWTSSVIPVDIEPIDFVDYINEEKGVSSLAVSEVTGTNYIRKSVFSKNIEGWRENGAGGDLKWFAGKMRLDPKGKDASSAIIDTEIPLGEYVISFDIYVIDFVGEALTIVFSTGQTKSFKLVNTSNIQHFEFNMSINNECTFFALTLNGLSTIDINNVRIVSRTTQSLEKKIFDVIDSEIVSRTFNGKNLIVNDNFKNTEGYWKSNNAGIVQQFNDYLQVDPIPTGTYAVNDVTLLKGKYLMQMEVMPTFLSGENPIQVVFSNGQTFPIKVKNIAERQLVVIDIHLFSDCGYIGIGSDSEKSFRLYNLYIASKENNVLEKIEDIAKKANIINGVNLINNGCFDKNIDGWRSLNLNGSAEWYNGKMLIHNTTVDPFGVAYDRYFPPNQYIVSFTIQPSLFEGEQKFYLLSSANQIKEFAVKNSSKEQFISLFFDSNMGFDWIAIVNDGKANYLISDFFISESDSSLLSENIVGKNKITNNIISDNLITNGNFETSIYGWRPSNLGVNITHVNGMALIESDVSDPGIFQDVNLYPGKYIVEIDIFPSNLQNGSFFYLLVENNDPYFFRVKNISEKQKVKLEITIKKFATFFGVVYNNIGTFYIGKISLFPVKQDLKNDVFELETNAVVGAKKDSKKDIERLPMPTKLAKLNLVILQNTELNLPATKDDPPMLGVIEYEDGEGGKFTKYASIAVQGSSSAAYAKKNWTIAFFKDETRTSTTKIKFGDWLEHDELVWKANWIDATQSRNIVSNRIWEGIVQTRNYPKREFEKVFNPSEPDRLVRFGLDSLGHVDGFPCEFYINNEFYGLGTFNLGKKRGNYNLIKNNNSHIQIAPELGANLFIFETPFWELRNPSNLSNAQTKINRLFTFNQSVSANPTAFKAQFANYYNVVNVIDYMLFIEFLYATDCVMHNFLMTTWDGDKWSFMPYDLDTTFGLFWDGSKFYDYQGTPDILGMDVFWQRVRTAFLPEMKHRYSELKSKDILSANNVYKHFMELGKVIGKEGYDREHAKWTTIPSNSKGNPILAIDGGDGCYTSLAQVMKFTSERLEWMDSQYVI